MTTAESSTGFAKAWTDWRTAELPIWSFVFKTMLAMFAALWIGLRFDIENARSAMITVVIVAQPFSGNVMTKSFYRVLGTLVGVSTAVILVSAFAQSRDTFIVAMAIWVGLCTMASTYFRNFRSYAFLLAGYTACLVGFPSVLKPEATYDYVLSRTTVVMIGILSAGLVAEAFFPLKLASQMVQSVRLRYREFASYARMLSEGKTPTAVIQEANFRFAGEILSLEAQRISAYLEDIDTRLRGDRLRLFNTDFMATSTALYALHQWLQRLRRATKAPLVESLVDGFHRYCDALLVDGRLANRAAEAVAVLEQLRAARETLAADFADSPYRDEIDFEVGHDLLLRFADRLIDFTETYVSLAPAMGPAPNRPIKSLEVHTDGFQAFLNGGRAALVLVLLCAFWIATEWPQGASTAILGTVVCALFAQAPSGARAALQIALGGFAGWVGSLVYSEFLMTRIDDFLMLAVTMAPFLMLSLRLTAAPAWSIFGTGFNLIFLSELEIQGGVHFDLLGALNDGFAQLLGMIVAGVAFAVLIPTDADFFQRRRLHVLRKLVRQAAQEPLPGLGDHIESRARDLLGQMLPPGFVVEPARRQEYITIVLAVLEASDAIINARQAINECELFVLSRRIFHNALLAVAEAFEKPSIDRIEYAHEALKRFDQRLLDIEDRNEDRSFENIKKLRRARRELYRIKCTLTDPDHAALWLPGDSGLKQVTPDAP